MNSPTRGGVYTQIFPTDSVGDSSHEQLYMVPAGVHAIQSTNPENWPQSILHPSPMPFCHSPSFVMPATSSSTLQPAIQNGPSASTNPPAYTRVPQRQYALTAHHFTPAPPILFNVDSGEPGIRLSAALNRRFTRLRGRDDLVFESSRSPTITMRLEVRDFPNWFGSLLTVPDSGQDICHGVGRYVACIFPYAACSP